MTPTDAQRELLGCPFCGAQPTENAIEPHTHHMKIDGWPVMPDHGGSHVIECACSAGMIADTRDAVLAMWNRRASPDEHLLRQAAEALQHLLDDTQHKTHPDCEEGPCPVREARVVAAALRQRMGGTK
jgi:hypothetical protein